MTISTTEYVSNLAATLVIGIAMPGFETAAMDLPRWFAIYTRSRHEKHVHREFGLRSIESFLPLYETERRWTDRRVHLQVPLFPGYIFARIALRNRLQVLQVPGVARLVGFNGTPVPLPQEEIDTLRANLLNGIRAKPHHYLTAGKRVIVKAGPLAGLGGILVKQKNKARFVVALELIQRALSVEVNEADLEPA